MSNESSTTPVALVTGAGRGIGASVAIGLAAAGHHIALNYRSSKESAEETADACRAAGAEFGIEVETIQADVASDVSAREMVAAAVERFGRLDVLVNNAGRTTDTPPSDLEGLSMDDWDAIFATNVRGLFQVTRAAAPHLTDAGGAIVNMASVVGLRPGPQPYPYSASKAAVISLTQTFAGSLGPAVRVNAVAPGWLEGEWMEGALGDNYDKLMERRSKRTPLGRCATGDDVADTVVSLVHHNHFVTGQVIVIDGGYTATT